MGKALGRAFREITSNLVRKLSALETYGGL